MLRLLDFLGAQKYESTEMLQKNGDLEHPKNWRPINLFPICSERAMSRNMNSLGRVNTLLAVTDQNHLFGYKWTAASDRQQK